MNTENTTPFWSIK